MQGRATTSSINTEGKTSISFGHCSFSGFLLLQSTTYTWMRPRSPSKRRGCLIRFSFSFFFPLRSTTQKKKKKRKKPAAGQEKCKASTIRLAPMVLCSSGFIQSRIRVCAKWWKLESCPAIFFGQRESWNQWNRAQTDNVTLEHEASLLRISKVLAFLALVQSTETQV